jgi:beta-1,4-mannooligosaccharide/beta-1,4-mannosyl-N-acetylglucosamine phosphorylase
MSVKIIGQQPIPNMPWQDKPAGCNDVVWRYGKNPVIPRDLIPCANSIFNSAVVPFEGKFAGVFRVDDRRRNMQIHSGFSEDGINWNLSENMIEWINEDPYTAEANQWQYGYDPRCVWIEDRYWVTWCNAYKWKPTIGIGYTYDFKKFYQVENAFLPFNRNGVLFPRKINGKYVMFSRPSDSGHTPFGDIYISQSPDMRFWGEHRHVMSPGSGWESKKIGAGPIPIETDEGWLIFYHGVLESCNGFVYSFGAALLDLDEPWKVIKRGKDYLINPRELYECVGDVQNVCFPCANLVDEPTGRIAIYYGCADTVVGLAFTTVDDVMDYLKNNSSI